MLKRYKKAKKEFVYFGDISNRYLRSTGEKYDANADVQSRKQTFITLSAYSANQFTKATYKKLPGKTSYKEFFADVGASVSGPFRLTEGLVTLVAPDMREYWNFDSEFG